MLSSSEPQKDNQRLDLPTSLSVNEVSQHATSPKISTIYSLRDSALINAVRNNDEARVRKLERTEAGLKNLNDETALMVAATENRPIFCQILVSSEKAILNYKQQDAYMLAAKYGSIEALTALRQHFTLRTDIFNMNALDYAVFSGKRAAVDLILASQIIRQSDISHAILLANKFDFKGLENVLRTKIPASKDFPCKRCEQYLHLLTWKMSAMEREVQTAGVTDLGAKKNDIESVEMDSRLLSKKDAEIRMLRTMYYHPEMMREFDEAIFKKNEEIDSLKAKLEEQLSKQLEESRFKDEVERYRKECAALQTQNDELKKMLDVNSKDLRSSLMQEVVVAHSSHVSPAVTLLHGSSKRTPVETYVGELREMTPTQPSMVIPQTVSKSVQVNALRVQNYELEIAALKARLNTAEEAIKRYRANYDSLYKLSAARQNAARVLKAENEALQRKVDQLKKAVVHVATVSNRQSMDLSNLSYRADDDGFGQDSARMVERALSPSKIPRCFSPNSMYTYSMSLDTPTDDQFIGQHLSRVSTTAPFTGSAVENRQSVQSIHAIAAASNANAFTQQANINMDQLRVSVNGITSISRNSAPVRGLHSYSASTGSVAQESRNSLILSQASISNIDSLLVSQQQMPPQRSTPQRIHSATSLSQGRTSAIISPLQTSIDRRSRILLSPELERTSLLVSPSQSNQNTNVPAILKDVEGLTPLMLAVIECNFSKFNESISYARKQTSSGRTALMYAVEYNRHTFVQDLIPLEAGIRDQDGHTALYHAITTGRYRIAELLRQSEGIQVSHRSRIGNRRTELMRAVIDDDIVAVWCLASMQASLQDEDGVTALMLAVKHMNALAIDILYPMEYKLIDKENRTAKDYIMLIPSTATAAQREAVQAALNRNKL